MTECEAPGSRVFLVARKYGINPNQLFRWQDLKGVGGMSGLQAGEAIVPESDYEVQALKAQGWELQRLLGKKAQEAEILRDAVELAREKQPAVTRGLVQAERHPVSAVARAMGIVRSTLHRPLSHQESRRPDAEEDAEVLAGQEAMAQQRSTYGNPQRLHLVHQDKRHGMQSPREFRGTAAAIAVAAMEAG